jgi:hypothetical protein
LRESVRLDLLNMQLHAAEPGTAADRAGTG